MATVDQSNNVYISQSVAPAVYTVSSPPTVYAINTQGFESVTIELSLGVYTDGNWGFYLETSDTNSGYTPILPAGGFSDNNNQALFPITSDPQPFFPYSTSDTDYTITEDNANTWTYYAEGTPTTGETATYWIGYAGSFEWVQPVIIVDDTTSGMAFGINIILGWPHTAPTRLISPNQAG